MAVLTKITTRTLADNSVTAAKIQADTIVAGDLAPNSVTASELADDAVDTAAIADDAVTNASIADGAIDTAAKLGSNVVTTAKIANSTGGSDGITTAKLATDAVTSAKIATGAVIADGIGAGAVVAAGLGAGAVTSAKIAASALRVQPHIELGLLYPSISDKQIDGVTAMAASTTGPAGSTVASSKWGTVQSDGRMYYYTDIKGSKPIRDPRIGAHYGSQRYKFKSIQKLNEETSASNLDIFSVDARDWCKVGGGTKQGINLLNSSWRLENVSDGYALRVQSTLANNFIEVIGFFNGASIMVDYHSGHVQNIDTMIDGVNNNQDIDVYGSIATPLWGRYQDSGSLMDLGLTGMTTPGIHTLKIKPNEEAKAWVVYGIELVAQDTTSTANKSKLQIPAQNVVSYGKKFTVAAATPHYDPFTSMSYGGTGTTLATLQGLIDTATSLGMDKWKAGTANYHRPWNGGRVVKWIANDGSIKTSVTMIPPNAQNIKAAANAVSDAHIIAGTNDDIVNFDGNATDNLTFLEEARTYYYREFGNGAGNTGGEATEGGLADYSMINGNDSPEDNLNYVFDDGLTSCRGYGNHTTSGAQAITSGGDGKGFEFSFIGSGITLSTGSAGEGSRNIALNLPYGTHVYNHKRNGDATPDGIIDGIALADIAGNTYSAWTEITFWQPKKPPIPDDACIIADYMLNADTVVRASHAAEGIGWAKGDRFVTCVRDAWYDQSSGAPSLNKGEQDKIGGFRMAMSNANTTKTIQIPFFGTGISMIAGNTSAGTDAMTFNLSKDGGANFYPLSDANISSHFSGASRFKDFNGTFSTSGVLDTTSGTSGYNYIAGVKGLAPGSYILKCVTSSAAHYHQQQGFAIQSPIHTSSHYQEIETPYSHELVGGDRNMEQTNLIVTPDGKTLEQLEKGSRTDLSNKVCFSFKETGSGWQQVSDTTRIVFDNWRGNQASKSQNFCFMKKYFAIAYDYVVCLIEGEYRVQFQALKYHGSGTTHIRINDVVMVGIHPPNTSGTHVKNMLSVTRYLKRGDKVSCTGQHHSDGWNHFEIYKEFKE